MVPKHFAMVMVSVLSFGTGALCAAEPAAAPADVRLPGIFRDNMVLQREMPVPVWGMAAPGGEVTVRIAGQEAKGQADAKGNWSVKLAAMDAGGPHEMTVSGRNTLTLKNVMVGEVWLCSGQSNMEKPAYAGHPIPDAKHPDLRLLNGPWVSWVACDPNSVARFSGAAYFFGREVQEKLKVPVGLILGASGGTRIEHWTPAVGYEGPAGIGKARAEDGGCYKERIRPFAPFAIRGVIWYQGESNCDGADHDFYTKRMEALVGGWRKVWKQGDFPFYFVQLAPWKYDSAKPQMLPLMWEAQTKALKIPNTGMAVITDMGNAEDIHLDARGQSVVGHRLALLALARTYGQDKLVCSGPVYKSMAVEGGKVRLKFESVGGGLASRDGKPLDCFEIAGEDRKFVPAKAEIDGEGVVVSADGVTAPAAVRFGWSNTAMPNLINKEKLPAAPFRTDSW
ncbi:MAG TPA: sialate O-acetylesterase [Planctomycetota bacterium]|nr:sialate O-acetylesterase [Planctomycetota bacterium]